MISGMEGAVARGGVQVLPDGRVEGGVVEDGGGWAAGGRLAGAGPQTGRQCAGEPPSGSTAGAPGRASACRAGRGWRVAQRGRRSERAERVGVGVDQPVQSGPPRKQDAKVHDLAVDFSRHLLRRPRLDPWAGRRTKTLAGPKGCGTGDLTVCALLSSDRSMGVFVAHPESVGGSLRRHAVMQGGIILSGGEI